MRVKDLAAELISEIAEEHLYFVYKFEKSSPGCGFIVYETEIVNILDDGTEEKTIKYKALSYEGPIVKLQSPQLPVPLVSTSITVPMEPEEIDLHDPESVQKIEEYFADLAATFDAPFGLGAPNTIFSGYSHVIPNAYAPYSPPSYKITVSPNPPPVQPQTGGYVSGTYTSPAPVNYGYITPPQPLPTYPMGNYNYVAPSNSVAIGTNNNSQPPP